MSWTIFKNNMLSFMQGEKTVKATTVTIGIPAWKSKTRYYTGDKVNYNRSDWKLVTKTIISTNDSNIETGFPSTTSSVWTPNGGFVIDPINPTSPTSDTTKTEEKTVNISKDVKSSDVFAKKLTTEYDMCIRRGTQTTNGVPIQTPNIALMETLLKLACTLALSKQSGLHAFADDIGKGILGYWTGATLSLIPPITPAPTSISNISTTTAMVTVPGTWKPLGPLNTIDDSELFLDNLIAGLQTHLTTIQGVYFTVSLYPAVPVFSAPGVVPWTGWTIPPGAPVGPEEIESSNPAGFFASIMNTIMEVLVDLTMSPAEIESAKLERTEANSVANDTTLPAEGRGTAKEYSSLKSSEISAGQITAAPVDLTDEELAAIEENTPDEYKCEDGTKIVAIAKRDIGILEYGTPPGLNYGGFAGGQQLNQRGRIDDMFDNVGLNNQSKVTKTGSGYYWCAAAVATWWQEAGLQTPSGGASCDNWMRWGKTNGYWSTKPKIGAAILYGSSSDAHHIGIVAGVTATGGVITIEGNTGGGAFSRNGCGVFQKIPKSYLGFVLPPSCV